MILGTVLLHIDDTLCFHKASDSDSIDHLSELNGKYLVFDGRTGWSGSIAQEKHPRIRSHR